MTEREYRNHEGISRSELWRLNPDNGGTPEKFKWAQEHPEPATPALIFGQVVHKLLLEPDTFFEEFAVAPAVDRRTKDGKAAYAEFLAGLNARQEIKLEDMAKAMDMVKVLRETPFVSALLDGAETEKPLFWTDSDTGEACKVRLDALTEIGGDPVIIDYKSTGDASAEGFIRSALKYGYDFQSGMYCEGVKVLTGKTPRFVFIAQEKEAPYSVNVLEADSQFILRGADKFRELLGIYHECNLTGNWYGLMGPDPVITSLMLPAWAGGDKS